MKLDNRHLRVSLALLVGSILYNVWVYTRPAKSTSPRPLLAVAMVPDAAQPPPVAPVDPSTIVAPPALDLRTAPSWARDPFASLRQAAAERPGAATAATNPSAVAEPVVRTILFSSQRSVAFIDGHIVRVGDHISAGAVAEITRDAVVIEMPSGERKRVPLRPAARQEAPK